MKKDAKYYRLYRLWKNMKRRCTNESDADYKSYGGIGVTVSDEWKQFKHFYEWYLENEYDCDEGLNLDKDLLGGMEYGPDTCVLLPSRLNFALPKKKRAGCNHTGVQIKGSKFQVKIRNVLNGSKNEYVGTYGTMEEALSVYNECKMVILTSIFNSYRGIVPDSVFEKLMKYKIEG